MGSPRFKRRFWTPAEIGRLKAVYPHRPASAIAAELGRTVRSVYATANNLGLFKSSEYLSSEASGRFRDGHAGMGTQFRKGNVPHNKGRRRPGWGPGRMKETQFKKGCRSGVALKNWRPIGTITADHAGYLRIKVREAKHGKERTGFGNVRVWPLYHRYVWEQVNGPLPAGYVLAFKDGNRNNCGLENLELVSRAEMARRNRMWTRYPHELAVAIQLNGVLKRKLRNAKK